MYFRGCCFYRYLGVNGFVFERRSTVCSPCTCILPHLDCLPVSVCGEAPVWVAEGCLIDAPYSPGDAAPPWLRSELQMRSEIQSSRPAGRMCRFAWKSGKANIGIGNFARWMAAAFNQISLAQCFRGTGSGATLGLFWLCSSFLLNT